MDDVTGASWFGWAVVVVIGLPVATIGLTELHAYLVRRRNSLAGPVALLRTYILPSAALLVLLRLIPNDVLSNDGSWVRLTATLVGFLVLMFVLSSLNAALFLDAAQGSWRQRMPRIFIDLVRVILIGAGLAILFSIVWGTNIGGLFAALGVTSIVLGFALQNAVGSVVSGLLLLFEQPFQLGDWLEFGAVKGRVVEVNWRSVHIESGNGVQIVPNASLAGGTFTNLSRPTGEHVESIDTSFAEEDAPLAVIDVLNRVALGLTALSPGKVPSSVRTGAGAYSTSIPVGSLADAGGARAQFQLRLWYAARRVDLRLNGADVTEGESLVEVTALLRRFAPSLRLETGRVEELAPSLAIERYAEGEIVMGGGDIPQAVRFIADGRVAMQVPTGATGFRTVITLETGDSFGQTALTRTSTVFTAVARTEVVVLVVPREVVDRLVDEHPALAQDLGRQVESLRQSAADALGVPVRDLAAALRDVS